MEGACVFIDENNFSTLLMYKEIKNCKIFFVKYNFIEFKIDYLDMFDFCLLLPCDCIHILSKLPYLDNIELTIDVWRNMDLNKLEYLNRIQKNNKSIY